MYTLITLLFLVACDSASDQRELVESAPDLPLVTVESEVRGAFLGVWGESVEKGRVWFVGGEKTESGETRSLIARYEPQSDPIDDSGASPQGLIGIEDERQGGILWWVWGSGVDGELWAVGEEGQILRRRSAVDIGSGGEQWVQEEVMMPAEQREKLVLWGVWGLPARDAETEGGEPQVWAVGGSVRRGGPKGVLLKRTGDGVWRRVEHPALPIEAADDPIQGLNIYKVWGNRESVWLVGEGSLTLVAPLKAITGESTEVSDWSSVPLAGERSELLFTVAGSPQVAEAEESDLSYSWVVGGYAEGRAWRWRDESWTPLSLPASPALNGVACSHDLVVAVGAQGSLLAWRPQVSLNSKEQIHRQWVGGAESMILHSAWASPQGKFWIVGGDLTTLKSGVIITPSDWSPDYGLISREEW